MGLIKNKYFLISLAVAYFARGAVRNQLDQEDGFFSSKYKTTYMLVSEVVGLGTVLFITARLLKLAKK